MKIHPWIGCGVVAAITFVSSAAFACGGLFCSSAATVPSPVDQTAERIVFEVGEGEITTHVQIEYMGAADEFAWVVPVPTVPEVEESTDAFINDLDLLTAPQVQAPTNETCPGAQRPSFDEGGGGCGGGCASDGESFSADSANNSDDSGLENPVTVHERSYTKNFEFVTISAEQSSDLVEWLQENNYNVSDNMIPVMQPYVDGGMVFLGLKLRDGRSASDIVPIKMTYEADNPMIPIQLTAVAAQPHMGIVAMILGNRTFKTANYEELRVATEEIVYGLDGRTNYFDWVARQVAERDGQAAVLETAMVYDPAFGSPLTAQSEVRYVTRFYTRLSPHHMTVDPMFEPDDVIRNVAPFIDLSQNPSIQCTDFTQLIPVDARIPSACAFNYCGEGSTCYEIDGLPHCQCPDGAVAQRVAGPDGTPRVSCQPGSNTFGITPEAGGVGTALDPCSSYDCGTGTCVLKAGFPTCECDVGSVACLNPGEAAGSTNNLNGAPGFFVECVNADLDIPSYGPGAGPESVGSDTPLEELTQFDGDKAAGTFLLFLLVGSAYRIRRSVKR